MDRIYAKKEEKAIDQIRSIILREDRSELQRLRTTLENREELSKKVSPIIEERIEFFKQEFPTEFEVVLNDIVEQKIKDSQQEILDTIYPVMGKMIKKYIQHQFELLRENINEQIQKRNFIARFFEKRKTRMTEADYILSELDLSVIQEVYVIQKQSGILLGSLAETNVINPDALAGMFTAIKLFVEDAFLQQSQDLETIRYENYQIFIYNCHTYYIAVAVEGGLTEQRLSELEDILLNVSASINPIIKNINDATSFEIKKILKIIFS